MSTKKLALLIIVTIWITCPSIGEWINKVWCTDTMEYYLVTKRNVTETYRNMNDFQKHYPRLNERNLTQKEYRLRESIYMKFKGWPN